MLAIITLGVSAFLLCLFLTPMLRDIFLRADIVDRPDSDRKRHLRAVPRMGGIPIVVSYVAALAIVFLFAPDGSKIYIQHGTLVRALLPAAGLVFFTGLADDIFCLKPWQKLAGQVAAALLAVFLGARLSLGHGPVWLSVLVSIVWLVSCTNAVNLIDGMDGLATGVGLLATVTTLIVALLSGNFGLAMATVPLAGCLLAFLRYNFSPASIFLGDCGSLTIGFFLGCFGLIWSQQTGHVRGVAAPLMALALPLIDVGLAIGRRFLRNAPIFKGDRAHIHHMVLALGFSPRGAVLILYGFCSLTAVLALLVSFGWRAVALPVVLLFCLLVLIGIRRLHYIEFTAALRSVSHKVLRKAIQEEIYLDDLERALSDCESAEECWSVIRDASQNLNFATAHMKLDEEQFSETFQQISASPSLRIQLSLGERGHLVLTRSSHAAQPRNTMVVLQHLQRLISRSDRLAAQARPASLHSAA